MFLLITPEEFKLLKGKAKRGMSCLNLADEIREYLHRRYCWGLVERGIITGEKFYEMEEKDEF